jgi:hypothetical protein
VGIWVSTLSRTYKFHDEEFDGSNPKDYQETHERRVGLFLTVKSADGEVTNNNNPQATLKSKSP